MQPEARPPADGLRVPWTDPAEVRRARSRMCVHRSRIRCDRTGPRTHDSSAAVPSGRGARCTGRPADSRSRVRVWGTVAPSLLAAMRRFEGVGAHRRVDTQSGGGCLCPRRVPAVHASTARKGFVHDFSVPPRPARRLLVGSTTSISSARKSGSAVEISYRDSMYACAICLLRDAIPRL
ncbi:hypothetical protein OH76DRAFT_1196771 [Lentinus brumalis]|uniref:Uncharacterized protein n=1 Tax=Lentinus brumalis TaxID=2498619 RepID=A0A371CTC2_9APHY|nr:hypothetical protein OH76DRAFT_1196771 [Polyporus brumalis]